MCQTLHPLIACLHGLHDSEATYIRLFLQKCTMNKKTISGMSAPTKGLAVLHKMEYFKGFEIKRSRD